MIKEIWKDIPGYDGLYQVSNLGNLKSLNYKNTGTERVLKQSLVGKKGNQYLAAGLRKNGICKTTKTHIIVAIVFKNHIPNGKMNIVVDHINNIKTDNRAENIQLITQRENIIKFISYNKKNGSSKYTGVCWNRFKNKWMATITYERKQKHLGYFNCETAAYLAYEKELKQIFKIN